MSSRPWTFLYALQRAHNATEHAVNSYLGSSANSTIAAAFTAGYNALVSKDLTSTICMTGTAMQPILNRWDWYNLFGCHFSVPMCVRLGWTGIIWICMVSFTRQHLRVRRTHILTEKWAMLTWKGTYCRSENLQKRILLYRSVWNIALVCALMLELK